MSFSWIIRLKILSYCHSLKTNIKKKVGRATANSYDAVYIYANALKKINKINFQEIKHEISQTSYEGVSGNINFDTNGCAIRKESLFKIIDGKKTVLSSK